MSDPKTRLHLIEDDAIMGESLVDRFELEGFEVDWSQTAAEAIERLERMPYAAVISDLRLPDRGGDEVFAELRERGGRLPPFLFITGHGSIDRAVALLKLGAADFLTKPFDLDELVHKIRTITAPAGRAGTPLGLSGAMRRIEEMLPRLGQHASTVLITGESGVGKEHVARYLHALAHDDAGAPFIDVNCGALSESLLESELFGHERGAFTGAVRMRRGVFEQANGGTLFLDEIGEMSLAMQVRLLRAIQERAIVRVGGETRIPVKLRLVCATHRDLKRMVEAGEFREDLYYRVHVIHLRVPPLRERREDILYFARRFLQDIAGTENPARLHPASEQALLDYPWPGNLRELRHVMERAVILGGQEIQPEDLFEEQAFLARGGGDAQQLSEYLGECERSYIQRMLARNNGSIMRTAEALGISRKNLWEKMRKHDLSAHPQEPSDPE